jgi:ribosome-interacting GTPase 1
LLAKLKERRIELIPKNHIPPSEASFFQKRALFVANKSDLSSSEANLPVVKEALHPDFDLVSVSTKSEDGLENLRAQIFSLLDIIRVYSKIPGKKAEKKDPFTLKKGSTVMSLAKAVHKDFAQKLKFARIWSEHKYQGQKVNRDHILEDEDIIELHI